ncbi:M1 family metallopeptidase [Candidatus Saccharibacteria bacterium]|nr:M1 family metallopeptidase [Candidatus Saccharibacteria bacterium]
MERLLDYFVPDKYILDIAIDKIKKTIGGVVTVNGEILQETVKFHAVRLKITDVLVNGEKSKFKADGEVLEIISVPLGEAEITIYYNGKLNENMEGAYLSTYEYEGRTETIVATQFESHYAREAFPCIDEPAAKAEFEVSIDTPDKDDIVLVNTPSPRMSTYLLAWVIGKFHGKTVKNKHGVEITTYCSLNQDIDSVDFANEIAARSLEFYDDNFKEPYPLRKLDQVALPDFEAGAMENWGLVTYRESMLLAGKNATLGTKKSVALTVAHELSHQWFGDLVTMEWWDDLWLNESFASVMEYYAVDAIHPEYKIFEGFFTGDAYAALMRDAYSDVQSVHQEVHDPAEIATLFDGAIVYAKGARLMLMLIRLMGWEQFCRGVADYFNKYKYQNTRGDDLWECLKPYAEFDPKDLMHAFIDKPGYPVITGKSGFRQFTQKRFLLDGKMSDSDWPLPEITEDMSGHYILNLSENEFNERLAKFDELGLEEKLRLLIDRNLLAKTELASASSLLPLVMKFKNEDSAAVWGVVLSIVSGLKVFFEPDSEEEKKYKALVGELVKPKLAEIGFKTRKNDDENMIRLRAILLGLDFYAETQENIKELAKMYDNNIKKLEPEIREAIIDAKLYTEPEMIDEYLQKYQAEADPEVKFELLFAGTISKDGKVLKRMLKLLEQPEIVKPQDQLYLYVYLYRNPRSRKKVFEWLTKHWGYVREMAGDKTIESYPRYTAGVARTIEEFDEWKKFFQPMKDDSAVARAVMIGEKEIAARLKLIKEDQEAVRMVLKSL